MINLFKKKYMLILAAVTLGVTGCNNPPTAESNIQADDATHITEENTEAVDIKDDEKAVDTKEEAKTENVEENKNTSSCPRISFEYYYPEINSSKFHAWWVTASVENEGYDNLNSAIKTAFEEGIARNEDYIEYVVSLSEDFDENMTEMNDGYIGNYESSEKPYLKRCDSSIVSIDVEQYTYSGGAHGSVVDYTYNFDTQTGKLLAFEDLGDIASDAKNYILSYIDSNLELKESLFLDYYEETIENDFANDTCTLPFYLDGRGVNIIFPQYEIAPYASGKIVILVPYAELKNIKQEYIPTEDFYTIDLNEYWLDKAIDVNNDGTPEEISIEFEYNDSYDYITGAKLHVGDKTADIMEQSWHEDYSGLIVHKNGHNYIFINTSDSNDWKGLMIYELGDDISFVKEINEGVAAIYYDCVQLETRVNILGTYGVQRDYVYDDTEALVPLSTAEDCYSCTQEPQFDDEYRCLQVKKDFEDLNGILVIAGTKLFPVSTNNEDIITMVSPEGQTIRILFERKDEGYGISINGVDEQDIFGSEIPYVG